MKLLWVFLLGCGAIWAQATPFNFVYCVNPDCSSTKSLFTPWEFPGIPEGEESHVILEPVNPTTSTIKLITATLTDNQNFLLTNDYVDEEIAPGQTGTPFLVHFTPQQTGSLSTTLNVLYCYPDASGNCGTVSQTEVVATFTGTGDDPQVVLSCNGSPQQCNGNALRPAAVLDFGNVGVGTAASIKFTVTNNSQAAVSVTLQTAINLSSPFSSDPSAPIPSSVAAGESTTFLVDFTPGQAALAQAMLVVGGSSFPLQASGVASTAADLGSLVVSYTDITGVREIAQGGTIDFGQVVAGVPATMNVSVCNPQITTGAVTVPVPVISGAGFTASGLASGSVALQPAATPPYCQPGPGTLTFQIGFTASAAGPFSGTLSIGSLHFSLTAQSVTLPLPTMSFQLSEAPLTSSQQVTLTIQLAAPATIPAIGTLTMAFAPSVANVTDDPAVEFLATSGRQLNVSVAAGSQTAAYNGQSALAFQTGTTAGTLTFTLQFPDAQPVTQSFTIAPEKMSVTSASATLSSPNIVVTINGYDNTYSAGQLSFTFYDTKGNPIAPGAIAVDASSQFHQYFFNNDPAGGAFALQAMFPVYNGDASDVGSVSVTVNNSLGATTTKLTVQ